VGLWVWGRERGVGLGRLSVFVGVRAAAAGGLMWRHGAGLLLTG
jgi:hypothetical protein